MRALLHLGLFAFAFAFVSQASADDDDRGRKRGRKHHTTVVIAPEPAPRVVRPVRVAHTPRPPAYDWRYGRHERPDFVGARQELYEQRRDHDRIIRLVNRWEEASAYGNPHAQRNVEWRVDGWIEREIAESSRRRGNGRYVLRLHELRRQLWTTHRWHPRGHARHRRNAHKARVLGDLVVLSENQLRRARALVRSARPAAVAYYR